MKISAAIVIYENELEELEQAIDSCLQSQFIDKLYLIDNSANDSLGVLAKDPIITYVHNGKNMGFGAAHNLAIAKALQESDYHLMLNPDIRFDQEVVERLVSFMEEHQDVGLVMPKILYPNGYVQRLCKLLPKPIDLFARRFSPKSKWAERRNALYELHDFDYNTIMDVPSLSGCFMFARVAALRQVGGFDSRYFMYMEDVDLVRRLGKVSRTLFFPHVQVYHVYRRSSYTNVRLSCIHLYSAIKYFNKWGWFKDPERDRKNEAALKRIDSKQFAEKHFFIDRS